MAESNNFEGTVKSLLGEMSNVLSTKTVVGEPIHINDTIILPLVDVSFGMGAGSKKNGTKESSQNTSSGGAGVKMSPSAVLVIRDGTTRLVNIKNQDTMTKVLDMLPELVGKFTDGKKKEKEKPDDLSDADIIQAVTEPEKDN